MAIWHFKFGLVPEAGLKRVHGEIPRVAHEGTAGRLPRYIEDDEEQLSYWIESDPFALVPAVESFLPETTTWGEGTRMFGTDDGDQIHIWPDYISCRWDMRSISANSIDSTLQLARENRLCLIIDETGEVVAPHLECVLAQIERSRAYRFCQSPLDVLREVNENPLS